LRGVFVFERLFEDDTVVYSFLKTKSQSRFIASVLFFVFFVVAKAWALNPSLPPGQNFDLSIYKLQSPLTNAVSGGVLEVFQPQLATYTSNIFYTAADGAMVFWVPTAGVPIAAGGYPRSELRQLAPDGDWVLTNNVGHLLTATCKILTNPPSGKTIFGQIHGTASDEIVKLLWDNGTVKASFETNYGATAFFKTNGTWNLGDTLSYSIQESNHLVIVTVNGIAVTNTLNSSWDVDTYYFKAGNYCQDKSSTTNTVCVVAFYGLNTNVLGTVGAPVFNPPAGNYTSNQTVAISTPTMGSSIRYTTNGSTPTQTNGIIYSAPVNISATTTLNAIAYDTVGILPVSSVSSAGYFFLKSPTITNASLSADHRSFTLTGTGGAGQTNLLLKATNLMPLISWTTIATNIAGVDGVFILTDSPITNSAQRFYRVMAK
jgi:Alginate lyase/Chitobiase/beta-hexosaminidase C-terminal domain